MGKKRKYTKKMGTKGIRKQAVILEKIEEEREDFSYYGYYTQSHYIMLTQ